MQNGDGTRVVLQPRHALQVLGALVLMLVAAYIGCQLLRVNYGPEYARSMVRLFNLDGEGNLPTLFSTGLFLLNALLFHFAWRSSAYGGFAVSLAPSQDAAVVVKGALPSDPPAMQWRRWLVAQRKDQTSPGPSSRS